MLHRASNNLLPSFEASEIVGIIRLGSGRQVFNALTTHYDFAGYETGKPEGPPDVGVYWGY